MTNISGAGNRLYLLSHQNAPTFQVLTLEAGQPLAAATVLVAAQPGRLIESIGAAADGFYVLSRRGLYSEVTRVPLDGGAEQVIALPVKGSVSDLFTDPLRPGAAVTLDSWATPPTHDRYHPATARLAKLDIGSPPAGFDPKLYAVSDLHATAKDGAQVPLSPVSQVGARRPQPVLLNAYGSYGASGFTAFSSSGAMAIRNGIAIAECRVRGGGELGEAWRLGGKDANKPNTWRDLIACGEELIAKGDTTKQQLFILGGRGHGGPRDGRTAGPVGGRARPGPRRQHRPRGGFPYGVPNMPEFGTVKTEAGSRNLLAMDSYLHVKDGTAYPSIMITTGLNDPRVASWQPAKLAARLRAAGGPNPVLLRIEEQAGHGIGNIKAQGDAQTADIISFVLWRSGRPGWAPAVAAR